MNLDAPPAAIAEMERQESLHEDVLRRLTIRVETLEEGPSAMLQKRDRDDRRDDRRGGGGGRFGDRDRDRGPRRDDRDRPRRDDDGDVMVEGGDE
jgi:small subunit ribosomal protein S6